MQVIIELTDAPTVQTFAAVQAEGRTGIQAAGAAKAQLARINQAQEALSASLKAMGAKELYRTQRVYNGIAVKVDAGRLAEIQQLPNVKAIHPLVPKKLDLTTSVPLIGAPNLWNPGGPNLTGKGIKIGIIDSGIDYEHADFGGAATSVNSTLYISNDTTIVGDVPGYPSAKVAGGHDFVGDLYDADCSAADEADGICTATPQPDDDPAACLTGGESADHGTHVAGIAAGYGVKTDGTTYTGPYSDTIDYSIFRIGPGVAPEAELYALRVFGCNGTTNEADAAIEWAVDPNGDGDFSDHLDVINMSLGSNYGSAYDSTAIASDNAALAGVTVVASAGNAGDAYYVTGSPATSNRTISVGSSRDSSDVLDGFRVNSPSAIAGKKPAAESVAYNWLTTTLPLTGTLVYPQAGANPAQDQRTGCYTFDVTNTQIISGNFVLLDWNAGTSCGGSVARTRNAVNAGAKGALLVDNKAVFDLRITGSPVIPAMSIPKSVGDALKANPSANMTFDHGYASSVTLLDSNLNDTLSSFSSRGPRRGDTALKPDITAPGDSIFSAYNGTGNKGLNYSGTSMAAPHVAGAMALLRQKYPLWTVEELKALAMNTALVDLRSDVPITATLYGPGRVGAGRISLPDTMNARAVAYNAGLPGAVSVSFGAPEVEGTLTAVRRIRVLNKQASSVTYDVAYRGMADVPGVSYTLAPAQVTIPAGGAATIVVTMTADASKMKHTADPTVDITTGRAWLSEEAGYVMLGTLGSPFVPELRVPVYAAPRPASDMEASTTSLKWGATKAISLTGTGVDTSGGVTLVFTDTVSLVSAFELQYTSPDEATSTGAVNSADLKRVGAMSNFKAVSTLTDTEVYFGIATHGNWSTPNDTEFDIYIDVNRDGVSDFVLFNYNYAQAAGGRDPDDIFVTVVVNLATGRAYVQDLVNGSVGSPDTAPFNNSVMVMPVFASRLGLTSANSRFNYFVVSFSRDATGPVDVSSVLTYDAGKPGLDLTNPATVLLGLPPMPAWIDLNGLAITVGYNNMTAYMDNKSQGVLLLHHHNATDMHDQALPVTIYKIYLPVIRR